MICDGNERPRGPVARIGLRPDPSEPDCKVASQGSSSDLTAKAEQRVIRSTTLRPYHGEREAVPNCQVASMMARGIIGENPNVLKECSAFQHMN
eukprot:5074272-Alexandrium_andersonii.AAC.1